MIHSNRGGIACGPRSRTPRITWAIACAAALFTLAACQGTAATAVPARLVEPDAAIRAELQRAVAAALGDPEVVLADTALTTGSLLVVERRRHVAPDGTRIMGRELDPPERFRLLREGDGCILVHEGSARRFPLAGAVCEPESGG